VSWHSSPFTLPSAFMGAVRYWSGGVLVLVWGRSDVACARLCYSATCGISKEALGAPLSPLVTTQVPSLPTRNEWGESWREGDLNKTRLLSPALSSFLRQEEREKCSAIGNFSICVDTNGLRPGPSAFYILPSAFDAATATQTDRTPTCSWRPAAPSPDSLSRPKPVAGDAKPTLQGLGS
jgi:hypothetical protein